MTQGEGSEGARMWGIIPAAGLGSRIQPLAFSKELLPVGSRVDERGVESPRAVSEYLVERMVLSGARRLCFVISPEKIDILRYFGNGAHGAEICYAVQPEPLGLCDAIFRASPLVAPGDDVTVGLPDSLWFPCDALRALPAGELAFLLFPVERPEFFDVVVADDAGRVSAIHSKQPDTGQRWIWGAFRMPAGVFFRLHELWISRGRRDEFFGPLVNAYLAEGGRAVAVRAGEVYADVGTVNGYREAQALLARL